MMEMFSQEGCNRIELDSGEFISDYFDGESCFPTKVPIIDINGNKIETIGG
jgi:hypothetical protein